MKKLITLALSLILALACLSFVACKEDGVAGTYKFYQLSTTAEGVTVTFNIGDEAPWGDDILSQDSVILELKEDGTLVSSAVIDGQTQNSTGTWTVDGDTITLTMNGDTATATIDGDTLTQSYSGHGTTMTYVYKKA